VRPVKRAHVGWPPALRELKELLYEVYLAAGAPSLNEIAEDIVDDDGLVGSPSRDTVYRVIADGERPGRQADVVAVATVLARRAAWDLPDLAGRVRDLWMQAIMARDARSATSAAMSGSSWTEGWGSTRRWTSAAPATGLGLCPPISGGTTTLA
jgi:hypothetical protein